MGNFAGKENGVVHPVDVTPSTTNGLLRVKVRMTKRQLEELVAQVDNKKLGQRKSEDLGCVIMKECLEGRLRACVVLNDDDEGDREKRCKYERSWKLGTISKEEEEHQHLL